MVLCFRRKTLARSLTRSLFLSLLSLASRCLALSVSELAGSASTLNQCLEQLRCITDLLTLIHV